MGSGYYRRKQECEVWHFCRNCSQWPGENYIEQPSAPSTGQLCNECEVKRRQGNCT